MNILVTGGAGFIGSHFVHLLLKSGREYCVVNLDKLSYAGNLKNLSDLEGDKCYTFIRADIADSEAVYRILGQHKIDAVVNFAAETHVDRSIENPFPFYRSNILGVLVLLENALKHKVTRFIQVSTDEVYGSVETGEADEDAPIKPSSPYSASKASADLLIGAYKRTYSYPAMIVRGCNCYGPNQYPEKLIPLMITNLLRGKLLPVYAKGKNVREWIWVEDFARGILRVLEKGRAGEVYNIGTGERLANIRVVKSIIRMMGATDSVIQFVKDRPGHDLRYALCSDKVRELGWLPEMTFSRGIKLTIQWYRENPEWWLPRIKK